MERWPAAIVTGAWQATSDFPTAAPAFVMGSLNFVIQKLGHASTVADLQLGETVKGMAFICTFFFSFCSDFTTFSKGPLCRHYGKEWG